MKSGVQAEGDNEDLHRALGTLELQLLMCVQGMGGPYLLLSLGGVDPGTGDHLIIIHCLYPEAQALCSPSARAHRGGSLSVLGPQCS